MIVLLLVILFICIILLEAPTLIKKKMWRELTAFSLFLLVGAIFSFFQVLRVKIFNPTDLIEMIFKPLAQFLK